MAKEKRIHIGADGKEMTPWQIWLKRLCLFMITWAGLEVIVGAILLFATQVLPREVLDGVESLGTALGVATQETWALLGLSVLVGAFLNVVIAFLGIRGAENPKKITVFFWIAFIDALIIAWALAGNVSVGLIDPSSIISGLFVIALAVCAWQVRKQTGYFDRHP